MEVEASGAHQSTSIQKSAETAGSRLTPRQFHGSRSRRHTLDQRQCQGNDSDAGSEGYPLQAGQASQAGQAGQASQGLPAASKSSKSRVTRCKQVKQVKDYPLQAGQAAMHLSSCSSCAASIHSLLALHLPVLLFCCCTKPLSLLACSQAGATHTHTHVTYTSHPCATAL